MSDIVERLRSSIATGVYPSNWIDEMNEAASEIERLRASVKEAHEAHHQCIDMLGKANMKIEELQLENEKLRSDLDGWEPKP